MLKHKEDSNDLQNPNNLRLLIPEILHEKCHLYIYIYICIYCYIFIMIIHIFSYLCVDQQCVSRRRILDSTLEAGWAGDPASQM